jgi:hypothetical protein
MTRLSLFTGAVILSSVTALLSEHKALGHSSLSLASSDTSFANASIVENVIDSPAVELPGFFDSSPLEGSSPKQWRIAEMFKKRQEACSNYCGPTESAPKTYCGCGSQCCGSACCATSLGQACCGNGFCCNTAAGAACCGTACCVNGATCKDSNICAFRT